MRVLGLDASTTTVGISVIEYDGYDIKLIYSGYHKPNKKNGILNMLVTTRNYILSIATKYSIDEFIIEDYIRFMKGNSSSSTIIPLAILNMTLRLMAIDILNIQPQSLNVLKIRHALKFTKTLPKKEDMPELVANHLNITYPWIYKINKKTKNQEIADVSYDVADAIAVALAFVKLKIKEQNKSLKKRSK